MRAFLAGVVGSLVGVVLAMLVYDVYIAQPREARLLQSMQQLVADLPSAVPDIAAQREEAKRIADELDQSVARSIGGAREAMTREAALVDERGRIADGITRASMHKLAVAESYLSTGKWPATVQEAGLHEADAYAAGAIAGIALLAEGVIEIRYGDAFPPGTTIRLIPQAKLDVGTIDWRCEASGFEDRSLLPSPCR